MSSPIELRKPHSMAMCRWRWRRPRCRAGEARGEILDAGGRHHAAAGVQQQEVARVALLLQPLAEAGGVVDHHGAQRRIDDGGGKALVLEDLGQHFRLRSRSLTQRMLVSLAGELLDEVGPQHSALVHAQVHDLAFVAAHLVHHPAQAVATISR